MRKRNDSNELKKKLENLSDKEREMDEHFLNNNKKNESHNNDDDLDTNQDDEQNNEEKELEENDNNEPKKVNEDDNKEGGNADKKNDDIPNEKEGLNTRNKDRLNPRKQQSDNNININTDKNINLSKMKEKAIDKATEKITENSEVVNAGTRLKGYYNKVTGALNTVASWAVGALKFVLNPFFWIVIGIIIVILGIISTFQIMGGNDYNKLCDHNGVGSVTVGDDVDDFTRQSAIASWLMSTPFEVLGGKPMSREQAMGVMGNLIQESYGANPKAIQGDHSLTRWQTCDNDCVGAFVGGGQAVGILQWDGAASDPRRSNLVKLARAEGKQWYDLNVQLKHLKMELDAEGDHTYENHQMKKSGFTEPGKTIEEYTKIWSKFIERCGKCNDEARVAAALEFDSKFQGAGASLSSQCLGSNGSLDTSGLGALASSIAFTREEKKAGMGYGSCPGGNTNCGLNFSKPEYVEAKKMADSLSTRGPDVPNFLASCDRLVATMVIVSGIDTNFPWGSTGVQIAYMNNPSSGWQKVSCQDRQPGDVFGRTGHIMIYAGLIDGQETVVSASLGERSAHMSNISCVNDLFVGDEMSVQGWRKVN